MEALDIIEDRACKGPFLYITETEETPFKKPEEWMIRALAREACVMLELSARRRGE